MKSLLTLISVLTLLLIACFVSAFFLFVLIAAFQINLTFGVIWSLVIAIITFFVLCDEDDR